MFRRYLKRHHPDDPLFNLGGDNFTNDTTYNESYNNENYDETGDNYVEGWDFYLSIIEIYNYSRYLLYIYM